MPMLNAFRLMLIFAMLDPIKVTVSGILRAVGKPEKITYVRIIQLFILVLGLYTLGWRYNIEGVSISLNIMIIVGIGFLFWYVKPYVDYSISRLFIAPLLALIVGVFVSCFSDSTTG